ncbi:MAG: asparagine synthetase B, partial [Methylococcaceae bacterium]|nr:asparagine synthetase B [Methylococcaceae bacterium]
YGFQGSRLLFASELKAFAAHPDFAADIDRGALSLYIRHGCVPAPHCIYRGICKLPAGSWLQLPLRSAGTAAAANSPLAYWRLSDAVERGRARPFVGSASDAAAALEDTLGRAVRRQMLADVPLGAFLSGGIDSSAIVSLMQAQSSRPIRTFAVGFTEAEYNEAGYAKAVAEHLHTEHTELYLTPGDALGVIPQLAQIYDEPFADSSQIPTVLLARMARRHVTVALSGDAGDEMLCGYNRYRVAARWGVLAKIPLPLRRLTGQLLQRVGPDNWRRLFDRLGRQVALPAAMTEKLDKFALQLQRADDVAALYYGLVSALDDPGRVVVGGGEPATWLTRIGLAQAFADPQAHMMFLDAMSYLPDDILVKVDRAAMAASLETRMPFLDPDFVEFAWSLPAGLKFRQGQGKWLLRQMLYRRVPQALLERPKSGFAIPLGDWLAGPLRDWCESLLAPERLRREGFFDVDFVGQCWHQHRSRQREWQTLLWNVLMFQSWLEGGRG